MGVVVVVLTGVVVVVFTGLAMRLWWRWIHCRYGGGGGDTAEAVAVW